MKTLAKVVLLISTLLYATPGLTQSDVADVRDVNEELKLAAVEALITAPDDKALPLVSKVLAGNHSTEVKRLRCSYSVRSAIPRLSRPCSNSRLKKAANCSWRPFA